MYTLRFIPKHNLNFISKAHYHGNGASSATPSERDQKIDELGQERKVLETKLEEYKRTNEHHSRLGDHCLDNSEKIYGEMLEDQSQGIEESYSTIRELLE